MLRLDCGLGYVVFAQRDEVRVDLAGLVRNATRWFGASVEILEEQGPRAHLRFEQGGFWLSARRANEEDRQAAELAEARGRAGGMASLAARCPTLWEVEPEQPLDEARTLTFLGLAASVALGPVLPPDGSTLFGVRGARERAARAAQKA
jgi:hypothetical protein